MRLEDLAARIGTSRFALADAGKGKATTSIAIYVGALWALGLLNDLEKVADPDRDDEGKVLAQSRAPGRADRSRALGHFIYGKTYLARPDRVEIDPIELRLSDRPFETAKLGGFFGAIRDAMPDAWGRRIIEKRSGHPQLDEFDYLMASADDRAGALGFGLNVEPPAPRRQFNKTLQLEQLQIAADLITTEDKDPVSGVAEHVIAHAEDFLFRGSSMGGARPKAVIEDHEALWIAKFSHPDDRWSHPKVEQGILQLAATCGLNVADSQIVDVAGRAVLLVRRFDRKHTQDGFRRHRMVSALTLLRAGDRVADRTNWSYLSLADEIRRSSANPNDDLEEVFKRKCFNAAISNLDDHPRNHAMIAKDSKWRLSPAYDLTPIPVHAIDRRDLAMAEANPGWRFTAVDPAGAMLDICRQRADVLGVAARCTFHEGHVDGLTDQQPFDAATCILVSHFMVQADARRDFFRDIAHRLRPDGLLINADLAADLSSPGFKSLSEVWLRVHKFADVPVDLTAFGRDVAVVPPPDIEQLLISAGFDTPVQFFQNLLIHAWYSTRSP